MIRVVVSEMRRSEHIGEYAGRTWAVEAETVLAAMEEIDRENPGHGPLRVVDGPVEIGQISLL